MTGDCTFLNSPAECRRKHLMRFQSETSVSISPKRSVDGYSLHNRFSLFCFQGKFYRRLLFAVVYLLGFSLAIYLRPRHLDPKRIETRDDKVRDF